MGEEEVILVREGEARKRVADIIDEGRVADDGAQIYVEDISHFTPEFDETKRVISSWSTHT